MARRTAPSVLHWLVDSFAVLERLGHRRRLLLAARVLAPVLSRFCRFAGRFFDGPSLLLASGRMG